MATNNSLFGMGGEVSTQNVVYGPDGKMYGNPAIARAAGVTNYTMSPPTGVMPMAGTLPFNPMEQASLQVVVYGPDGTAYGTPAAARAAGVTNYTMSPPTSGRAAPAYTQQYVPGNFRPEVIEDTNIPKPLPTRYGDPIYGLQGKNDIRTLIGRVGMTPVVTYDSRDQQSVTFVDDPVYQKSQQMLDFERKIASGEVQSSGLYGPALDGGRERRAFVERESAYQSYDPATDTFKFYDLEGNVTQQGPRAGSVLGGALGGLMTGLNQTAANPDFQRAVMLAALATAGGAALSVPGIPLDALPATSAGAAGTTAGTTAGLLGSPFAPAASAAGSSAGYLSAAGGGIGSTLAGLGGSPFAPAASAAGQIPGYVSAAGVGATGIGSVLEGLGGSPFAPAGSAAASMPGYVGAAEAGGGLLSTLGNAASSLLPSASTASSFLPSLITGGLQGLGAANTAEKAREAAQIQAAAQVEAARIAADAAKFRPVGVTTRFGASNFTTDAQGNVIGAGYTASPEIQAYQNRLSALAAQGLTGAEGAQAAYAPLTAGAQSLFNLGQGYIQQTPEQQAADYIAKQQALLAPGQQQQLAQLQNTLQAQGRGGLSVAQGGNLMATSPELAAYYNALAQSNLQLAAQGQQAGQQQAQFGAGLLGAGSDLMGKYYGGQTAAYAPFATAMDTSSGLESLAERPLSLGTSIGARTTASAAEAGRLLSQGMINSAATQAPANAFSQSGNIFGQFGSNPQLLNALNKSFGVTDPNQAALSSLFNQTYGVGGTNPNQAALSALFNQIYGT